MEKERPDALEMATQEDETREEAKETEINANIERFINI